MIELKGNLELKGDWEEGIAINTYNDLEGKRTLLGEAIYRYMYRKQ